MFLVSGCPIETDPVLWTTGGGSSNFVCESCGGIDTSVGPIAEVPLALTPAPIPDRATLLRAVDDFLINGRNSEEALLFGWPMGIWDVSNIVNFDGVFDVQRNERVLMFNEDLTGWNVSSAVSMERMFAGALAFNGNITTWNTGNVRSMRQMFYRARSFQGDLSTWDTSSCYNMASMFEEADRFNGDLSNFDTSLVFDMSFMFRSALAFTGRGLALWDTASCENMAGMFEEAVSLESDLSSWVVSSAITMEKMFRFTNSWNVDISSWDVANVNSFRLMVRVVAYRCTLRLIRNSAVQWCFNIQSRSLSMGGTGGKF